MENKVSSKIKENRIAFLKITKILQKTTEVNLQEKDQKVEISIRKKIITGNNKDPHKIKPKKSQNNLVKSHIETINKMNKKMFKWVKVTHYLRLSHKTWMKINSRH